MAGNEDTMMSIKGGRNEIKEETNGLVFYIAQSGRGVDLRTGSVRGCIAEVIYRSCKRGVGWS